MLIPGQLESDHPLVMPLEVPAQQLAVGQAIPLHKGCPDGFSRPPPSKLKLDTGGFEFLKRRVKVLVLARVLGLCLGGPFIVLRRESL